MERCQILCSRAVNEEQLDRRDVDQLLQHCLVDRIEPHLPQIAVTMDAIMRRALAPKTQFRGVKRKVYQRRAVLRQRGPVETDPGGDPLLV